MEMRYSQSTQPWWIFQLYWFNQTSFKIRVLFLYMLCTGTYVSECKQTCPDTCTRAGSHMTCPRIPQDFPSDIIRELIVTGVNFRYLFPSTFEDTIWTNLTMLDLHGYYGNSIRNRSFVGLKSLVYLGIHGEWLVKLEPSVFEGLDYVRVLDLSDNDFLRMDYLLAALDAQSKRTLPLIENLTIASLYSLEYSSLTLNASFFKILSTGRHIKYIDISNTNIKKIDFNAFYLLCNSVEYIKARNVSIADANFNKGAPVCESLRTLDISDLDFAVFRNIRKFTKTMTLVLYGFILKNLENLYINGIFEKPFVCESCTFIMTTECDLKLKKIEMRRNQLKFVNITTRFPIRFRQSVSELDLSSNLLEFISPENIYFSKNLEVLNISNNKLFVMQVKYTKHFQKLLYQSKKLRKVSIAENGLGTIPKPFFNNNPNLKYIDLSRNKLTSVEFDIQHMTHLKYLDLSHNMFVSLDAAILGKLGIVSLSNASLQTARTAYQNSSHTTDVMSEELAFRIDLQSNPFKCGCSEVSIQFIGLIQNSVALVRGNETYSCDFQGESINILTVNLEDTERSCALQKLLAILRIVLPILFVLGLIAALIAVLLCRRAIRIRRYNDFLNQLNRGEVERQFLVFMSFCSEDTDFALEHIAIPLQETLVQQTKRDRNYICIGDREFRLGLTVYGEVMRCIEESSVVLFVVSNKFCKKGWCRMEVGEAYSQGKPIIILMKEHVEIDDMSNAMKKIFNRYTHASWVKDDHGGHLEPNMQVVGQSIIELAQMDFVEDTKV